MLGHLGTTPQITTRSRGKGEAQVSSMSCARRAVANGGYPPTHQIAEAPLEYHGSGVHQPQSRAVDVASFGSATQFGVQHGPA